MRQSKHSFMESQYEELAIAIIMQAADDYKRYKFLIDTINLRKYKNEDGRHIAINRANREIKNVESFFHSSWFYALSGLNGERALVGLKETYKKEYYPVRLEELMDNSKIGRFRFRYEGD